MTAKTTPLPLRNDTIFGVCEAIGNDFGFHPNWLRVALAGVMFLSPMVAIGIYFGLGTIVALTHWIAPNKSVAASAATIDAPAHDVRGEKLSLAA